MIDKLSTNVYGCRDGAGIKAIQLEQCNLYLPHMSTCHPYMLEHGACDQVSSFQRERTPTYTVHSVTVYSVSYRERGALGFSHPKLMLLPIKIC